MAEEGGSSPDHSDEELEGAVFAGKLQKPREIVRWTEILVIAKKYLTREEIDDRILEAATNQLRPYIPSQFLSSVKMLPTDLYYWKQKDKYVKRGVNTTTRYHCFLQRRCKCKSMLKVTESEHSVYIEVKFPHTPESHSNDCSVGLAFLERERIVKEIQADPTHSASTIDRILKNKGEAVPIEHRKKIPYMVRANANAALAIELEGVVLDGTLGSLVRLKEAMWFEEAVNK